MVASEPGYRELRQRLIDVNVDLTLLGHNRDEYEIDTLTADIFLHEHSRRLDITLSALNAEPLSQNENFLSSLTDGSRSTVIITIPS